ncbi:hypothetical protein APY94_03995 [Thermococcus celericrescens]|uniref:Uncharacterized protein n=1 Tax=Thermococcus celericrescens TaxID=227598 RepID=A0A100XYL6_9EURY|nr:hypothetical protein [Thermococcus celericrescens]KUH33900.1 hypothetical protein APY94_03995 [Thermococcus celericrescens]
MVDWAAQGAKLRTTDYLAKVIIVAVLGGFGLMWAANKAVTVGDYVTAIAKTPVWIVLAIELLDKFSDKKDYTYWGITMSRRYGGHPVLWGIIIAVLAFAGTLYVMTGTIAMNMSSYSAGVLLAAITYSLYIVMPETGDDELILFLWIAATIATKGQYLNEAVFSLPFISKLVNVVISKVPISLPI